MHRRGGPPRPPFASARRGGILDRLHLNHRGRMPTIYHAAGSGSRLGEVIGIEADFGRAPGFFQTEEPSDAGLVAAVCETL